MNSDKINESAEILNQKFPNAESNDWFKPVIECMQTYAEQSQQKQSAVWVKVSAQEELPVNSKPVFCFDEKGIKRNAFYVGEENKVVCEFEDYDDGDTPEWLTVNERTETYYYKIGWYEELENSGTYDFIIYPRKITHWLKEQPQKQLSESEIEKLAEKETYVDVATQSELQIMKQAFIKGLTYKLTATPQQADEVQNKYYE